MSNNDKNVSLNSTIIKSENSTITPNISNNNMLANETLDNLIKSNTTSNNVNQSKQYLPDTIKVPFVNKNMNTNLAFCLGIGIPVLLILLVIIICYFIKKRLKAKISSTANDSADQKQIQMDNIQKKLPYNRIQNTSGLNNMALTPNNLSEIKVHNLKEEINNIMSNSSGSSSGRRKRAKKKQGNNSNKMPGFDMQEGQKEMQNEIKEQIKQYVIDEKKNNV